MPFMINCTNKGCCKHTAALLDLQTDKVHCEFCDGEINVTFFTKSQLKSFKQVKQKQNEQQSYSFKCNKCLKSSTPILKDKQFVCKFCAEIFTNISEPFKIILKEKLKNG